MENDFLLQTLRGHDREITTVAFSSDAKYLFTGSNDCNIAKWDLLNGKLVYKFIAHSEFVSSLAISPDSKYFVSGSSDHTAKIWDFESGNHLKTLDYYRDSILCVLVSFDGERIVTGGSGTIKVWDYTSGQLIHNLEKGLGSTHTLTITPVGEYIAGTRGKTVKIWNLRTGKLVREITKVGPNQHHDVILFSPLGKNLIFIDDKNISIIDIKNEGTPRKIKTPMNLKSLDMSSDGKYLLGLAGSRFIYLWNFSTGELIKTDELPRVEDINILKFSPDAKYIVGGLRNGIVKVWAFTGGKGFNYETYLQVKEEIAKRVIPGEVPKETEVDKTFLESEIKIHEPADNLVFISYSTKDKDIFKIKEIAKQLTIFPEIRDALYWEEDMDDNIVKYMSENLGKCDVFILFSSPNALASKPIEKEWTAADVMDKPIIPVFFKIEHIPPLLRSRLGVEFDQFNIDATVDKIHQLILKKVKEKKP